MTNYVVQHELIAGAPTVITVTTFEPAPLLTSTVSGSVPKYFTKGQVVNDSTDLGGNATLINRHLGLGAIK